LPPVNISLDAALRERDDILTRMDSEAAKAYIVTHGGKVPRENLDWEKVLHLARLEVTTLPGEVRSESRVWLARNGAQSIMTLGPDSPYVTAVLDLIFPAALTDAYIAEMEKSQRHPYPGNPLVSNGGTV
jgi:hypothetical protein